MHCMLWVLQEAHARLFPIDYDDNFYSKAVHGLDRWAAGWQARRQGRKQQQDATAAAAAPTSTLKQVLASVNCAAATAPGPALNCLQGSV